MAEIFKGLTYDFSGLKKFIVIKRILPHIAANKDFIRMLIDEAKIAVRLNHGNIAQTFDLGKVADDYFIVMEFVDGRTISQIYKKSVELKQFIPIPLASFVVSELANGMDYIHRRSDDSGRPLEIVHRDISPQNVIISYSGNVKIVDFGVAKAVSKLSELESGVLKGKFAYMSPEQTEGIALDHRSDIFSTGVVLWEMLTGRRLFKKKSNAETIDSVQNMAVYPPSAYRNDIPSDLDVIVMKCLERNPNKRYSNASDLSLALTKFILKHYPDFKPSMISDFLQSIFVDEDNTGDLYQEKTMREDLTVREKQVASAPYHEELLTPVEETMIIDPQELDFHSIFEEIDVDEVSDMTRSIALKEKDAQQQLSQQIGPAEEEEVEKETTGDLPRDEPPPFAAGKKPHGPRKKAAQKKTTVWLLSAGMLLIAFFFVYEFLLSNSPGTLNLVFDPPDASVTLDGVAQQGTSPLLVKGLIPRHYYQIKVVKDYYEPQSTGLSLWPGVQSTVQVKLIKLKTAPLKVSSNPEGAAIYLNGQATGKVTPADLETEGLKFPITLGLSLGGPPQWEQPIESAPLKPFEIHGNLQRAYASVDVESSPSGAKVSIDGKEMGKTPLKELSLAAGEQHSVHFELEGYKAYDQTFSPKPGETNRLYHALEKKPSR